MVQLIHSQKSEILIKIELKWQIKKHLFIGCFFICFLFYKTNAIIIVIAIIKKNISPPNFLSFFLFLTSRGLWLVGSIRAFNKKSKNNKIASIQITPYLR